MYNAKEEKIKLLVDAKDDGKVMAELRQNGYFITEIRGGIRYKDGTVCTWIYAKKGK